MLRKLFILVLLVASKGAFGQGKFIARIAYISFITIPALVRDKIAREIEITIKANYPHMGSKSN